MLVGFCTESTKGHCQDTPPLPPSRRPTVEDPRVDQPQMKKSLGSLQVRPPIIPWGSVGDPP
jgi:hypothetical protein